MGKFPSATQANRLTYTQTYLHTKTKNKEINNNKIKFHVSLERDLGTECKTKLVYGVGIDPFI